MSGNTNILIVEDEKKIADLLRDYLERSGFAVAIQGHGDQVVTSVRSKTPDLILLDIMLPGMDGMEICRQIRQFSAVPIIMITARVEEIDRLIGLELGADDYICKPFSPREVVARVKAVLRRTKVLPEAKPLILGRVQLDEEKHIASIDGEELKLTPIEFGLLQTLMSHPDRIFTRNELIRTVSGYEFAGYDRTIDSHIKNLRKKISGPLPDEQVITTVYGFGYRFGSSPE